jgi:hypothetical protein
MMVLQCALMLSFLVGFNFLSHGSQVRATFGQVDQNVLTGLRRTYILRIS